MGLGKRGIAIAAAIASMWASTSVALAEGTKPSYSANGAFTTDYVFRGVSQNAQEPAMQGGADFGYGMFYAGAWGSMVDFGPAADATAELDLYAGIKKSYSGFDFDVGAIYYLYPGASDAGAELDFVEIKFGVATTVQKLGLGATVFYSPEYTGKTGETVTLEGKASYELTSFQGITPSISGLVGTTISTETNGNFRTAFDNKDEYVYWNAGMSFAIDKLTLDFRYWDTNLSKSFCNGPTFQCDERFVFTAGISF